MKFEFYLHFLHPVYLNSKPCFIYFRLISLSSFCLTFAYPKMKKLLALVCMMPLFVSNAQDNDDEVYDTARRTDPLHCSTENLLRGNRPSEFPDSSMLFMQQYDVTKKSNIAVQNLGDLHTPFIPLLFKPFDETGMQAGMNPFMNLYFRTEDARAYDALMPYTEFHYAQGKGGQRGMIDFDAFHTQNFGRQFNISAKYHSASNDGFYARQSLSCKNIQLTSWYISKNNRYIANASLTWNKCNMMENGGIIQSSAAEEEFKSLGASVRLVEVSLNNARNINRFREHSIQQVYWLLMKPAKDSSSEATGILGIRHGFKAMRNSNLYTDQAGDYRFYDSVFYFNPDASTDSFAHLQYSNTLEIFTPGNQTGLSFRAGVRYDNFTMYQGANQGNFYRFTGHNSSLYTQFHFNIRKVFRSEINAVYYAEGYNRNDYQLKWSNRALIGKDGRWQAEAGLFTGSRKPFYRQTRAISNHYKWNNDFQSTIFRNINFSIGKNIKRPSVYDAYFYSLPGKSLELQLNYTITDNYIYYDRNGNPAQTAGGQNCVQAIVKAHANLRKFQLHQELAWQTFSPALASVIQLPELLSKTSIYYQTYAFKKATFVQIGFDASVTSSYKAGIYDPALQNFRVSDKSVGAYPFMDFFINAEVRTARIFFKMEHINQDIPSVSAYPNYMFVSPFQASAPRRFRVGFIWKFYY